MAQKNFFVVEDDGIIAADLISKLESLGYSVAATASSGRDAVEQAGRLKPDFVFMDINLPGEIDGIEAAVAIRRKFGIPAIFVTAYADDDTLNRAAAAEPYGYVVKPFNIINLKVALEMAISRHNVERKLRQSEKRYRRLFDHMLGGFALHEIILDEGGKPCNYRFLEVNRAFEQMTGLKAAYITGRTAKEVFPDIEQYLINTYGWVADSSCFVRFESHNNVLDRYFDVTAYAPEPGKFATIFHDITQNRRAEDKLKQSEQKFRILADFTYDWEYWQDNEGKFMYVSPSVERISGYKPQDFYNNPNLIDRITVREDLDEVRSKIAKALAADAPLAMEFRIHHRDGREIWIGHTCQVILTSDGKKLGRRATNRDITQRKLTDAILRESEEKFQKAFRSSPMIMTISEIETGRYIEVNDKFCEVSGFSRKEATDKTSLELGLISKAGRQKLISALKSKGRVVEMELPLKARDGRTILCLYSAETVRLKNHEVMLSIASDITSRKQAEEERQQALNDLSHRTKELGSLYRGANAILEGGEFAAIAGKIFDAARDMIGAQSGYIALLSQSGEENEVLFLEFGDLPYAVDQSIPMPVRGLRAEVYKTGRTVIVNDFARGPYIELVPKGHVVLKNVMFAPLNIEGKTVGIMGLANKPENFTKEDRNIAEAFGHLAAIALKNSRYLEAIKESEERFKTLVESAPEAIFVQSGGKFVYLNPAVLKLLGASRQDELTGKDFWDRMAPEYHDAIRQRIHSQRQTGLPVPLMEQVYLRVDGSRIDVETTAVPIRYQGQDAHLVFIRDISARKKAEEASRANEARYRELFEHIPSGVAVYDVVGEGKDFIFKDLNASGERIDNETRESLIGKSVFEARPGIEQFGLIDVFKKVWKTGQPMSHPIKLYNDNRLTGWYENYVYKLPSGEIVAVFDNVTDRKRTEEEMIRAGKLAALGTLVAGMAHEISNPNQYIQMNAAIFKKAMSGIIPILDAHVRNCGDFTIGSAKYSAMRGQFPTLLDGIVEGSERICRIVQELKDYVRHESPGHKEPFDINEAVESAVRLLGAAIRKSTNKFSKELSPDMPKVLGSKQRAEQVVVNLLQNALQALPDAEKAVSLRTFADEQANAVIEIRDEGDGIAPEDMQQLLDPFFTTRRETGGTGLGLAIADRIVREMGGRLEFESRVGKGTLARIVLPAYNSQPKQESDRK